MDTERKVGNVMAAVTMPQLHVLEDEPPYPEYDPGPEIDDEGGMSEYRHDWQETQIDDRYPYNFEDIDTHTDE